MSQQTLTTPIDMKNVTKIKPVKFVTLQDDETPSCSLTIEFRNNDNVLLGTFTVVAYDTLSCTTLFKNPTPASYVDRVLLGSAVIAGAYTALKAADDGASGNRSAHLDAVFAAAKTIGLISATDFASS
jgi:hypothetical protein